MTPRRRRRWPWLLLALLAAVVLLAPGLLGAFVHQRASAMLAESWPEATVRWQRGWFGSRVEAADGRAHLVLDFRHPAPALAGPLAADGALTLSAPEGRIALDALLGWGLDLRIAASADALERTDTVVAGRIASPALSLSREPSGALDLRLDAAELALAGPPDAALEARDLALTLTFDGLDPGRVEVELEASRPGRPASRLRIDAERIDTERAAALIEALRPALDARPGSTAASIAWLGAASAWEQLARAGLVLELSPLALDGQARIEARWAPAEGPPRWSGGGRLEAIEGWLVPILALARAEPPAQLREEFRLQLEQAAQAGRLIIDGDRFELPAPPPNG